MGLVGEDVEAQVLVPVGRVEHVDGHTLVGEPAFGRLLAELGEVLGVVAVRRLEALGVEVAVLDPERDRARVEAARVGVDRWLRRDPVDLADGRCGHRASSPLSRRVNTDLGGVAEQRLLDVGREHQVGELVECVTVPDGGEVAREQHLVTPGPAQELHDRGWPVPWRERAGAEVHVGEFQRQRHRFVDPRHAEVRQHERRVAEVERGAVDGDRARALARHEPARGPRLHLHRQPRVGTRGVERVVVGVVEPSVEAVGVEVPAHDPRLCQPGAEVPHAADAVFRVDERERGESSGPLVDEPLDLLPARRDVLEVVRVERAVAADVAGGENDGRDPELVEAVDERARLGEAVVGVAAHRHARCPTPRARRPTRRGGRS